MNELFEEMTNDIDKFYQSAVRFINACKKKQQEQQLVQVEPDYKSWVGKGVYVWDDDLDEKQKAILLDYIPNMKFPFVVAGCWFKHAELCEKQNL